MSKTTPIPHLQGPRLSPTKAGRSAGLVVLLHGYSMSGHDMVPIARMLQRSLPDLEFVAPHGHLPLAGGGRAWMALRSLAPAEFWSGALAARPLLDRFLDAERERLSIPDDRIVLLGFSQGAVLALHVGLRRPAAPAAIVAYAGLLAGPEHLKEATSRPPVTLIHGEHDAIVPSSEMEAAAHALRYAGIRVSTSLGPATGHTITADGVARGIQAIREAVPESVVGRFRRPGARLPSRGGPGPQAPHGGAFDDPQHRRRGHSARANSPDLEQREEAMMAHVQTAVSQPETLAPVQRSAAAGADSACCNGSPSEAGGKHSGSHAVMAEDLSRVLVIEFLEVDMPSTAGDGCSACDSVRGRLDSALEAVRPLLADLGTEVDVRAARVRTEAEARALGLRASPTIRIGDVVVAPEHRGTGEERIWHWRGESPAAPPRAMLLDALLRGYAATVRPDPAAAAAQQKNSRGELPAYLLQFLAPVEAAERATGCCGG